MSNSVGDNLTAAVVNSLVNAISGSTVVKIITTEEGTAVSSKLTQLTIQSAAAPPPMQPIPAAVVPRRT